MAIIDTFSYDGQWDRVGLDCLNCIHFRGPEEWPDKALISSCNLHKRSLSIQLDENGFKNREWFCKEFKLQNGAKESAVAHFNEIRLSLPTGVLLGLHTGTGVLQEVPFESLPET